MATPSKPVGYECEFVDQVPEDYFCKQCKHVAREPTIASCCTEVFCKACIQSIIQEKKPCSNCQETEINFILHKKYQPKILALKVHCSLKPRGCEWTGQLRLLDAHLDLTTGDCVYVDVDCPSKCDQKVQKCNVDTHLAHHCPNRDYTCPHCSFNATFREVSEHFEVCRYYPLVCPNRCGASFERDVLEDHMKMCCLQKVQCEFSYAGCEAEFIRDQQKEHVEQNTQKHLALVAAATLRISREKDAQIKALAEQLEKKLGEQQKEFHKQLEEKDEQIKALEEKHGAAINTLRMEAGVLPYEFTIVGIETANAEDLYIDSPSMYTNPDGYKFELTVWPHGIEDGLATHVSVEVYSADGVNDQNLKFPAHFITTLELLNQHRDQDHYTKEIQFKMDKKIPSDRENSIDENDNNENNGENDNANHDYLFISHDDLEWNADKQTQYLKNDSLKFRVAKIELLID